MRIRNSNNLYTDDIIRQVIQFTRPSGISNFDVYVNKKHDGNFSGRAFPRGKAFGCTASPAVVINIGKLKFPFHRRVWRGGYLEFDVFTQTEILVHLIAHELRHLWQAKHKYGSRVWGAKGKFSERDADAFAIHKVREWRREVK